MYSLIHTHTHMPTQTVTSSEISTQIETAEMKKPPLPTHHPVGDQSEGQ